MTVKYTNASMRFNYNKWISIFTLLVLTQLSPLHGQGNLPYVDNKPFHFGFSLGINAMDFGVVNSLVPDTETGKILRADVSTLNPGFSVGIISDLRLNRYLNLRFTPGLHFGDRELSYSVNGVSTNSLSVQSVPICIPVYLKYSAERKNNYRPYLIWGGGFSIDLGRKNADPLLLKPFNFYTEFGMGCDLYFPFFKLAPELKFALGFNDILTPLEQRTSDVEVVDKKFTASLSKLTSRVVTLTFNFE
jgi:hypothetical protein